MSLRPLTLLCTLLLACAPEPAASSSTPKEAATVPTTGVQPTTSDLPPKQCGLAAGPHERTITVGEATRVYLVEVGAELAARPPVVFAWHGFGSRAENSLEAMKTETLWTDAVVVAPRGMPRTFDQFGDTPRPGWQVAAGELDDRDLLFFDAMLAELESLGCVDASRVYSTGFSNGGFFSNVLACHRADALAAAAPTGGGGPFVKPCGRKIPVLITHGRADKVVPYASAHKTYQSWVAHNACAEGPGTVSPDAEEGCVVAAGCAEESPVRMCSYDIGHQWPQGQSERVAGFLRQFSNP